MIGFYLDDQNSEYQDINQELFEELENTPYEERPRVASKIIENNIGLVNYIISKRYSNIDFVCQSMRVTRDDIFSAATYGLVKAINAFEASKGNRFATYATRVIHNELGMFMRSNGKTQTDYSMEKVMVRDKEGNSTTFIEMLADENDYVGEVLEIEEFNNTLARLKPMIDSMLSERDKLMVHLLICEGKTQSEVASTLGLSQSYIGRRVKKVLAEVKDRYNYKYREEEREYA